MKSKNKVVALAVLIVLLIAGVAALLFYKLNAESKNLYISHDSGIYDGSFELVVKSFARGSVYYTTDGSVPGAENANAKLYEKPIQVELTGDAVTYSYQFCCLYEDGKRSEIYRRDYILAGKGLERFSTKYIVSVTGDEDALFGYEQGVFVRGRQFDEYMEANPDVDILNTVIPANYFSNEELPVHTAIFTADGTQVTDLNCGLRIYGNITRAKNQKSFRLTARSMYDEFNEFEYPFFEKLCSFEGHTALDAFQRLSFHNAGNDNGYAFIRTELVGELARRAGFWDVLAAESAVVFVNGRYQGVYWLNNTFDDRYFNEKYGDYAGEFIVCEGGLNNMSAENAESSQELACATEYNEFCKWVESADMNREADWQRVQDTIDVSNFAKYMAIEYYIGNIDWPHNNVKVYRYQAVPGENYAREGVFDGRYRYLLYDTDYGMGLKFLGWFGNGAEDRRLSELCNANSYSTIFQKLLEKEDFRTLFINEVLALMNTSFAAASVENALGELNAGRDEELRYMMEETDLLKNSLWESDDNSIQNVDAQLLEILNFANNRPATVATELMDQWDCGNYVTLKVHLDGLEGLLINDSPVTGNADGNTFVGTYFDNVSLSLKSKGAPGMITEGFYLNEQYIEGAEITFYPKDMDLSDQILEIRVKWHIEEVESLEIAGYHIRGSQDYVVLRNNGQVPVCLADYTLVDSFEELGKGHLPYQYLQPGEEYIVYGKSYTGPMGGGCQVSYGWATNEPILLAHASGGIVDAKNTGRTQMISTG